MKSKNVLNKVVNVCGNAVGERQEQSSLLYERRVVWKARAVSYTHLTLPTIVGV